MPRLAQRRGSPLAFANKRFRGIARKRFTEDLVEVLSKMGHEPKWDVTLGLETKEGQVEKSQVTMTTANRRLARDQNKSYRSLPN